MSASCIWAAWWSTDRRKRFFQILCILTQRLCSRLCPCPTRPSKWTVSYSKATFRHPRIRLRAASSIPVVRNVWISVPRLRPITSSTKTVTRSPAICIRRISAALSRTKRPLPKRAKTLNKTYFKAPCSAGFFISRNRFVNNKIRWLFENPYGWFREVWDWIRSCGRNPES